MFEPRLSGKDIVDVNTVVVLNGLTHPHAEMYLETLEALDEVSGVVLVDPDEAARSELSRKTQKLLAACADLDAALERSDVTHVLVALPNSTTPAAVVRAIDAGKSVFTEKPGARSAREFEPVLNALRHRPVPFAVAYLNRGAPAIVEARELYQAGAIGRLMSVELRMVTTRVGMRNPASWLFEREQAGGGILAWLACHWLDAVRFITGEDIVRVQAEIATLSGEPIDVEDTAVLAFRTSSGAVGSLHAGYLLALGNPGYRAAGHDISVILRGSDGLIQYAAARGVDAPPLVLESRAPRWRAASQRSFQLTPTPSPGYGGLAGLDFFRQFLAAGPGDPTPAGAIDALRVLEILDAAYASADSGCAVEVGAAR
jgi:predicted dehydrogenase